MRVAHCKSPLSYLLIAHEAWRLSSSCSENLANPSVIPVIEGINILNWVQISLIQFLDFRNQLAREHLSVNQSVLYTCMSHEFL